VLAESARIRLPIRERLRDRIYACAWTPGDIFVLTADPYYSGTSPSAGSPSLGTDTAVFFPSGNTFDGQGNLLFANNQYQVIDMLAMSSCSSDCPTDSPPSTKAISISSPECTSNPGTYGEHGSPTSAYLGLGITVPS